MVGSIIAYNIEEAKGNIKILMKICRECGLEINKDKSNILIFNMEDKPEKIEGIKVTENIKYVGIEIEGKRNIQKAKEKYDKKK